MKDVKPLTPALIKSTFKGYSSSIFTRGLSAFSSDAEAELAREQGALDKIRKWVNSQDRDAKESHYLACVEFLCDIYKSLPKGDLADEIHDLIMKTVTRDNLSLLVLWHIGEWYLKTDGAGQGKKHGIAIQLRFFLALS